MAQNILSSQLFPKFTFQNNYYFKSVPVYNNVLKKQFF